MSWVVVRWAFFFVSLFSARYYVHGLLKAFGDPFAALDFGIRQLAQHAAGRGDGAAGEACAALVGSVVGPAPGARHSFVLAGDAPPNGWSERESKPVLGKLREVSVDELRGETPQGWARLVALGRSAGAR